MHNKTRGKVPRVAYADIKNAVLGPKYSLSLAFLTPTEARKITKERKKKDKASNVLSFPLSKNSGEILICPATARKQAPDYELSSEEFIVKLFIHGLLHLKGLPHGATMDHEESRIAKKFSITL
jgi:probable rRNA maturation factor